MAVEKTKQRTPIFDWQAGEFAVDPQGRVTTATQGAAVAQIAIKALQTRRGAYTIYAAPGEPQRDHKYGSDASAVVAANLDIATQESELKRAAVEALIYDPFILEVNDITLTYLNSDSVEMTADLKSIFDRSQIVEGVSL